MTRWCSSWNLNKYCSVGCNPNKNYNIRYTYTCLDLLLSYQALFPVFLFFSLLLSFSPSLLFSFSPFLLFSFSPSLLFSFSPFLLLCLSLPLSLRPTPTLSFPFFHAFMLLRILSLPFSLLSQIYHPSTTSLSHTVSPVPSPSVLDQSQHDAGFWDRLVAQRLLQQCHPLLEPLVFCYQFEKLCMGRIVVDPCNRANLLGAVGKAQRAMMWKGWVEMGKCNI